MRLAFLALPVSLLFGCGDPPADTAPVADAPTEVAPSGLAAGCYIHASETDSVGLYLVEVAGPVTGRLEYALREKDRNSGTFIGEKMGDTIIGDYFFQSEGLESTREVAFLLRNGSLIEGYGPMTDEGTVFADRRQISFDSGMPLTRTDCPD